MYGCSGSGDRNKDKIGKDTEEEQDERNKVQEERNEDNYNESKEEEDATRVWQPIQW